MRRVAFALAVILVPFSALHAQSFITRPCDGEGSSHSGLGSWLSGDGEHACEMRHTILPSDGKQVNVSGENGGIEVVGEDRRDIDLTARVEAQGSSHEDATNLLHRIEIATKGSIHASGPQTSGWTHHGWSVSFQLRVPRQVAASLHTANGAITITDVIGGSEIQTTNGSLTLRDLAGEVRASAVNGGINIIAAGNQWKGEGLEAKTVNGPIAFKAPEGYSAHLVADTTNGGIAMAFPSTVATSSRDHLDTNLGHGGALLQFRTVNGGVAISRD